jgi:alkylation response protein AidB-like acyl-CoA dehydrogenase
MDLRPTDEQEQLVGAFAALYAKESSSERVREAEPLGFDARLWAQLVETGAVAMAVPEANGGWGASLLDLLLVAEQHGRALGSAPLVETQVAARLLAAVGEPGAAALADALAGDRIVTFAVRPARGATAALVPAGAVADAFLVLAGDDLLLVPIAEGERTCPENVGSQPLADLPIEGAAVLATGAEARTHHDAAVDEWLALTAGALVGSSQRSLEIGVEYTKERVAFGQPIGAFQAVAHRLADVAAATDGARLLARQAAWAAAEAPEMAGEHAAMAFAFAAETARDASYWSLHFHGGYGFMLEYDIQLHYRRSRAWANVGMSPAQAHRRVAGKRRARRADTSEVA